MGFIRPVVPTDSYLQFHKIKSELVKTAFNFRAPDSTCLIFYIFLICTGGKKRKHTNSKDRRQDTLQEEAENVFEAST